MLEVTNHDTSNCPLARTCRDCGTTEHLKVRTVDTATLGLGCMTLCTTCAKKPPHSLVPDMTMGEAIPMVSAHYRHTGNHAAADGWDRVGLI